MKEWRQYSDVLVEIAYCDPFRSSCLIFPYTYLTEELSLAPFQVSSLDSDFTKATDNVNYIPNVSVPQRIRSLFLLWWERGRWGRGGRKQADKQNLFYKLFFISVITESIKIRNQNCFFSEVFRRLPMQTGL